MALFRLLHASDLHIASRPERIGLADAGTRLGGLALGRGGSLSLTSSHDASVAEKLALYARELVENRLIDAIVLSGDLATTGSSRDLQAAAAFVRKDLGECGVPVVLIPGNHDRMAVPTHKPGGTGFDGVFASAWGVGQTARILSVLEKTVGGRSRLALVGADFTLRHAADATARLGGAFGQGRVHATTLRQLVSLTEALRQLDPAMAVLWVVHFPPGFRDVAPALSLINDDSLIEAAEQQGVAAILAGHTHECRDYDISFGAAPVRVLCAGTATQYHAPGGNFVHLVEIHVAAGSTTVSRTSLRFDRPYPPSNRTGHETYRWQRDSCPDGSP